MKEDLNKILKNRRDMRKKDRNFLLIMAILLLIGLYSTFISAQFDKIAKLIFSSGGTILMVAVISIIFYKAVSGNK